MIPLSIEFDKRWEDVDPEAVIACGEGIKVMVLSNGMTSGKPSIAFRFDLPDGKTAIAETSARLFCTAANMVVGRYPDLFEGD